MVGIGWVAPLVGRSRIFRKVINLEVLHVRITEIRRWRGCGVNQEAGPGIFEERKIENGWMERVRTAEQSGPSGPDHYTVPRRLIFQELFRRI